MHGLTACVPVTSEQPGGKVVQWGSCATRGVTTDGYQLCGTVGWGCGVTGLVRQQGLPASVEGGWADCCKMRELVVHPVHTPCTHTTEPYWHCMCDRVEGRWPVSCLRSWDLCWWCVLLTVGTGLVVHQIKSNQCYTCSYEAQKAHASHSLISRSYMCFGW
jgi:hypothetical protein